MRLRDAQSCSAWKRKSRRASRIIVSTTSPSAIYKFVWDEYCDWYLELAKVQIQNGTPEQQRATRRTLLRVLETVLRLAHPVIPFITEALWQKVAPLHGCVTRGREGRRSVDHGAALSARAGRKDRRIAEQWAAELKAVIDACRNLRGEMNLSPAVKVPMLATGDAARLTTFAPYAAGACAACRTCRSSPTKPRSTRRRTARRSRSSGSSKLVLKVEIDVAAERERLSKEVERLRK